MYMYLCAGTYTCIYMHVHVAVACVRHMSPLGGGSACAHHVYLSLHLWIWRQSSSMNIGRGYSTGGLLAGGFLLAILFMGGTLSL